jgi:hypothetical protein
VKARSESGLRPPFGGRDALPWNRALSDRRAWLVAFCLCIPVYFRFAHYVEVSADTWFAFAPAWQLLHHGNVWMDHLGHAGPAESTWLDQVGRHLVSDRMPGMILVNLPMYAIMYFEGATPFPAALTAVLLTSATVATMLLVLRGLTSERRAWAGAGVLALGTSLFTVASAEVWPHTVDALSLALAMLAVTRHRYGWAGFAFGFGILARPHIAVVAAVVGLYLSWRERSARPATLVGAGSVVGLVALLGLNSWTYQRLTLLGGYSGHAQALTSSLASGSVAWSYLVNSAGFLVSPFCGLLIYLPLALLLVLGGRSGWRSSPAWVRAFFLGGVAYSLVQLKLNGFTGGHAFFGYRLATELVVCAAPLAVVAYRTWASASQRRRRLVEVLAVFSIGIQTAGALLYKPAAGPSDARPWTTFVLWDVLKTSPVTAGILGVLVAGACAYTIRRISAKAATPDLVKAG